MKFATRIGILVVLGVVLASGAWASNTLSVTAGAAIEGNYGLQVTMDGTNTKAFVRDESPADESTYRATFLIDMNNLTMTDGDWHFIATFRAETDDGYASARNLMRVLVRYRAGQTNPYKIRIVCRNDDRTWVQPGGHSLPTTGSSKITVEWQASSAPGANDGFCRFYRNDILRAQGTGIDSDVWHGIGSATIGVDQVDAGTIGSIHYDSFESYRTLSP